MKHRKMIPEKQQIKISKFLSLVLRHQPETIGIKLDNSGWTNVADLLAKMKENGHNLDLETLEYIVEHNPKKRFAFNDDRKMIRANQGHSVQVELGYEPQDPPAVLYHGTGRKNVDSILRTGLVKGARHHVHLSPDEDTALKVGQRHGPPVIFEVQAGRMQADGFAFFVSENGVWLTDAVPVRYLVKRDHSFQMN